MSALYQGPQNLEPKREVFSFLFSSSVSSLYFVEHGFTFGTEGLSHETRVRGLRSLKQVFYRPIYFPNCYTIQKVKNWKGNAYEEEKPPCRRMFPQILYLLRRTQCYNLLIISVLFSMPPFPTLLLKSFRFCLGLAVFQPNEWQLFKLLSPKVTHPSLKFIFDTQIEAPS